MNPPPLAAADASCSGSPRSYRNARSARVIGKSLGISRQKELVMTPEEHLGFEQRTRTSDDAALRRLVILEASQYRPEVVDMARDELRRRGLRVLSPEDFWMQFPAEWIAAMGFCYRCCVETTDDSLGLIMTYKGIGTRLRGGIGGLGDKPCMECGSIIQEKWFYVIVPVVPLGKYRVIGIARKSMGAELIGRKLEEPPDNVRSSTNA